MAKPVGSETLYINIDKETLKEFNEEAKKYRLTKSSFFEVLWKFYQDRKQ